MKDMKWKNKKVIISLIIVLILIGTVFTAYAAFSNSSISGAIDITFNDENLYNSIKAILGEDVILKHSDDKKTITVSKETIESVETLNLSNCEIGDIEEDISNQEEDSSESYNSISNLEGLEAFTNLKELELQDNKISNISALQGNTTIETLNLNSNNLDDRAFDVLSTMTNLKRLGIGNNNDIDNIGNKDKYASLTNLVELTVSQSELTNLDFTTNLTKLEELYIPQNDISDFSKLTSLINLKCVDISENNSNSIAFVSGLSKLESLEAYNNNIEDISVLNGNSKIKILNLNGNKLDTDDINVLKTMTGLEELRISNNKAINEVSQINGLTQIKKLVLSNSNIKNVTGISNLTNLETLVMNMNEIEDITEIGQLTNLKELSLVCNNISDISTISQLDKLESLDLSLNSISSISDTDIDKIKTIADVSLEGQLFNVEIIGNIGENKDVDVPNLFKQVKTFDKESPLYGEVAEKGGELNEDNTKFTADIQTVSLEKGMGLEISGGILDGSKFVVNGTTVQYMMDKTAELKDSYDLDINSDGSVNEEDANILKKYVDANLDYSENSTGITDEQQGKINKLDLNNDNNVDEKDYIRFTNYINKKSNILITDSLYGTKVNKDVVAEVVSSSDNFNFQTSLQKTFTENGEYEFEIEDSNGNKQTLVANVNFIDKVAPVSQGVIYSTTEHTSEGVTVTINSNEELAEMYPGDNTEESAEDTEDTEDEETEEDDTTEIYGEEKQYVQIIGNTDENYTIEGWKLAEDKMSISKTFNNNTAQTEKALLVDEAGNWTSVDVTVNNIIESDNSSTNNAQLIMKKENTEGNEYLNNTWTNKNIYVEIQNNDAKEVKYSIDGNEPITNSTTITTEGEHSVLLSYKNEYGELCYKTYTIKIDKTNPTVGEIQFRKNNDEGEMLENGSETSENVYISVNPESLGQDNENGSGISKTVYTIKKSGEESESSENSVSSVINEVGTYEVTVITYDNAGNTANITYNITINR